MRHLQLVKAVAQEGGVTRAGRRLHLTQSALSHQLRDAEERLGVRLFDRIGKRMVLTPAGERLLRSARAVLEELVRTEQEIRRDAARARGRLRLTTQCNTVYHWLPSRRRRLFRDAPRRWTSGGGGGGHRTTPSPRSLEGGRIDLAIVTGPCGTRGCLPAPLPGRDGRGDDPRPPPGPPALLVAADFAPEHLILYSIPRESNLVFREVLIPAGVSPARVTHIQLTEGIVELVKAGLGISVLARWSVAPQIERGGARGPAPHERRALPSVERGLAGEAPCPCVRARLREEILARHPLPLGRTPGERRRIARTVVVGGDARGLRP